MIDPCFQSKPGLGLKSLLTFVFIFVHLSNSIALTWIFSIDSPHNAAVRSFLCLELGKENSDHGKATIMCESSIGSK